MLAEWLLMQSGYVFIRKHWLRKALFWSGECFAPHLGHFFCDRVHQGFFIFFYELLRQNKNIFAILLCCFIKYRNLNVYLSGTVSLNTPSNYIISLKKFIHTYFHEYISHNNMFFVILYLLGEFPGGHLVDGLPPVLHYVKVNRLWTTLCHVCQSGSFMNYTLSCHVMSKRIIYELHYVMSCHVKVGHLWTTTFTL